MKTGRAVYLCILMAWKKLTTEVVERGLQGLWLLLPQFTHRDIIEPLNILMGSASVIFPKAVSIVEEMKTQRGYKVAPFNSILIPKFPWRMTAFIKTTLVFFLFCIFQRRGMSCLQPHLSICI